MQKITEEIYLQKAQNGARTIVEIESYRILDGISTDDNDNDTISYFLFKANYDNMFKIETDYYLLDPAECCNILADKLSGLDILDLIEKLDELVKQINCIA